VGTIRFTNLFSFSGWINNELWDCGFWQIIFDESEIVRRIKHKTLKKCFLQTKFLTFE